MANIANKQDDNGINICLSCDDKYAQHTSTTIASILFNRSKEDNTPVNFYILSRFLTETSKEKMKCVLKGHNASIQFVTVTEADFKDCPLPKHLHFTLETYFRLKIASFFPEIDKMLYIDSDTVVLKDIKELYDVDLTGYALACTENICKVKHLDEYVKDNVYFNAGVILINCKKWREDNLEKQFFDFVQTNNNVIKFVDQDVLNCVLAGQVTYFDPKWNTQYDSVYDSVSKKYKFNDINLIHYISKNKPWNAFCKYEYFCAYIKYLLKTPWKYNAFTLPAIITMNETKSFIRKKMQPYRAYKLINKTAKNNRVLLWGASLFLKEFLKKHPEKIDNIIGIIDKNPDLTGTTLGGYKIYNPSELKDLSPDVIIPVAPNRPEIVDYITDELKKHNMNINMILTID